VETVPSERAPKKSGPMPVPVAANDGGRSRKMRAKVLIARDLPVTQIEIEVFALLLDDLGALAANDNGVEEA
jgi:hypothetical protein